jgi:hypothetical protein
MGVVGGANLTDGFQDLTLFYFVPSPEPGSPPVLLGTRLWSPSKDYAIGGMIEVHFLTGHWRRMDYSGNCTASSRPSRRMAR